MIKFTDIYIKSLLNGIQELADSIGGDYVIAERITDQEIPKRILDTSRLINEMSMEIIKAINKEI